MNDGKTTGSKRASAGLSGANLALANLRCTSAAQSNRWPEGFDPEAAAVTFE